MILSLSGYKGSGKNTVAQYLQDHYNFTHQIAFASTIKDILSALFGWDRIKLEGLTEEDRNWRNEPDQYWSDNLGKTFTPNGAMKEFGTDVMRQWIPDIWVSIVEKKLLELQNGHIIITDTRFDNEYAMLKKHNAVSIGVLKKSKIVFTHESDINWTKFELDYRINNDKTFSDLYLECDTIMQELKIHKVSS